MLRWTLLGVIALGGVAHAETPWYPTASLGAGIGLWFGDIGGHAPIGPTLELETELGLSRMFHLRLLYEHAMLGAHDEMLGTDANVSIDGVGLIVHHPLFAFPAMDIRVGGDMHVLAGYEYERQQWEGMPTLHRNDVVLGFGGSIVVYDRDRKHPEQEIDYGLRILLGHSPDAGALPPSSRGSSPIDHSMVMEVAWRWGR